MSESRIKISSIVENQLPEYVKEEFPLVSEFLSQYYRAIENKGSILDILQNIDHYVKVDNLANLIDSTQTTSNVSLFDRTINVESTYGFPDSYGLIKIDNEIITYRSKTLTSFNECIRGFVGIEEYYHNDQLKFSDTNVSTHDNGSVVENLSILFLKEFFNKVKTQVTPGFENRELNSEINENLFVKQSRDFYSSKGTAHSFEILFRALYGKDVQVILPRDFLIRPSDAQYRITKDIVVEAIEGDPTDLINLTLYQDSIYEIPASRGTISNVEKIIRSNKEYYVISLDYGYDNLNDTGLSLGDFSVHPKTRNVVDIDLGSDTLTVDSTLGFPSEGNITVDLENGTQLLVTYTSKSINQFYGCSGILQNIPKNSELNLDIFAYGYSDIQKTKIVKVRVTGVLSSTKLVSPSRYYDKGDLIKIRTIGKQSENLRANKWIFNISSTHNVKSVIELDSVNFKYHVDLYDPHFFYIGDSVTLISPKGQPISEIKGVVISVKNYNSIVVSSEQRLNTLVPFQIRKNIVNAFSNNNLNLNKYVANVQNTYVDNSNSVYVTSLSLPHYENTPINIRDRKVVFSGTFSGDSITIPNHRFYTGDKVVYNPDDDNNRLNLIAGKYYVRRVDLNTIKLSTSLSNLFNEIYLNISGIVTNNVFYYERFTFENLTPKTVVPQNLIRQIPAPVETNTRFITSPGFTGIFINGVELLNYKSNDYVYYGNIESIDLLSNGRGYDVINPPVLEINDSVGFGATAYCTVSGSLMRIDVIDGGVNYLSTPEIVISGGNGSSARAFPILQSYDYSVSFSANQSAGYVNLTNNTIGFSSYHKLNNGDEIIYHTNEQQSIGGIVTNSSYFVSIVDASTVKLHTKLNDALSKTNEVNLSLPYGEGVHTLKAKIKKRKIQSINVINPGINYKNRRLSTSPVGVNTVNNFININNHGFVDKDIVVYESTGTPISGLDTSKYYYVEILDSNNFRLYEQYTLNDKSLDYYYRTNQPANLQSVGSGLHIFKDEPIQIQIIGTVGVTTFTNQTFDAQLQPVFRGRIENVFVENGGSNYGSEDILNYNRQPQITLNLGTGAELRPVVSNGSISEVVVVNSGTGYNYIPDLFIQSPRGYGATLTPIIKDGLLIEVKVISGGVGYEQATTEVFVSSPGVGAKFNANIKSWQVNLVEKNIVSGNIPNDDGIIEKSSNEKFELEYSHAYAPRSLRKSVVSTKFTEDGEVYIPDLNILDGKETLSDVHSPIIGWAYDGNPIYGPYGYSSKTGGEVKLLKSSYSISLKENRPSLSLYPEGFFVEDYEYIGDGDLDESNGRFCVTPEHPYGIYAYFSTVSDTVETSGVFVNYRKPTFPYVIGDYYYSNISIVNLSPLFNQNDFDINKSILSRNTTPYYLTSNNSFYDYVDNPNRIREQTSRVTSVSSGEVTSINVINSGDNYAVGDQILFDSEGTEGRGAKAYISGVLGKRIVGISITEIQIDDIELTSSLGISSSKLNLQNRDFVTISGKNQSEFNTIGKISLVDNTLFLSSGIASASYTGLVTFMSVYPPINASVNDLFYLGTEVIKILNIDKFNSRVRILRNQNGTNGVSSYSSGYALTEAPTKFIYSVSDINATFFDNRELYFDPSESVGLGTTSGVGIGLTLYFANPGAGGTSLFVPTRTIYIPNHNIPTGTELLYRSNNGSPLSISTDGISSYELNNNLIVYSAKISDDLIGISTVLVGLGTTGTFVGVGTTNVGNLLYFTGIGTGVYHSLKLNPTKTLKADVSKTTVNVSTAETHGMFPGENILMKVFPGISTNITVKYDDNNRQLYTNPLSFDSIDVDIISKKIRINDHKLPKGQKVIYQEITPVGGLVDDKTYYAMPYGKNSIKLYESYYDLTIGKHVDITSTGSGKILPINSQILVTKNNTINFDLSDPSLSFRNNSIDYSAFDFNIYTEPNFIRKFEKIKNSLIFNVSKSGRIGIDTNASVSFVPTDGVPNKLYYRLEPKNNNLLPESKRNVSRDSFGEIIFVDSQLTGSIRISGVGSTTFSYTVPFTPSAPTESSYDTSNGFFEYERFSPNSKGKIKKIFVESGGTKYKSLPSISQILTEEGSGALLYPNGNKIGSVNNIEISDIGFSYPTDQTLRPTAKLPDVLKLYSLSIFDRIGISSQGIKYVISPDLVVIDRITGKLVSDVDLSYNLGDGEVKINKNVVGIDDVNPIIIPTNNSNGIGINSITYDSSTKNVTLYLNTSFSDVESFPFEVGKRILIESVGVASSTSEVRGYNSENYNYSLFTITSTDPNIGGFNPSITYSLEKYLSAGESPGLMNVPGFVVPETYFPIFDISLKKLSFRNGETVTSNSSSGIVQLWDSKNNNLKVATDRDFFVGELVRGESSGATAVISQIYRSDVSYKVDSSSIVRKGWFTEIGFLNRDTQRIQDSDYYQYFSYSLKSEISFDKWEESVNSLNHTAGFKKFSDLVINSTPGFVGIATNQDESQFFGMADLYSVKSFQCFDDFDLVSENNITINNKNYSDSINFNSRIIQDYVESIGNRVLKIDDISSQFNSNPRPTNFSIIDSFNVDDYRSKKYIIYITDRSFPDEKESVIVSLIHDGSNSFLNQYASVVTKEEIGSFDFNISGTEANLVFYPNKSEVNNYNLEYLSFGIRDNVAGIGTLHLGDTVTIRSETSEVLVGSISTTIVGIASTHRASKVLVQIGATDSSYFEFNELTLIHDGSEVYFEEYGQLNTGNFNYYSAPGIGTYHAYLSGTELNLDLILDNPAAVDYNINSIIVSIANTSYTGVSSNLVGGTFIESTYTAIGSTSSPGANLVSQYDLVSNSAYHIVVIEDLTNGISQVSELVVTNARTESYVTEYGLVKTSESVTSLGEFIVNTVGNKGNVWFEPIPNIDCEVRVFTLHIGLDETSGVVDFINASLDSSYGLYEGSSLDIKREFELKHNSLPIFKRKFDGSSSDIVDITRNVIRIPQNYFVTGEEVTYSYSGGPIGIETTSIAGIGTTDKLPSTLYIVKINDMDVQVSASASDALLTTPNVLNITTVGSGTTHHFSAKNENSKLIVSLDNAIQSPIVSTAITTTLVNSVEIFENFLTLAGITSFYGGDLIKVDDEIMKITGVGIGSTNLVTVLRPWMGSTLAIHTSGAPISKVEGNFNVVHNIIHFVDAPYGVIPLENPNKFDETDYSGISTGSRFSGRAFLRSGVQNSINEAYNGNYIFDNISSKFNGIDSDFTLTVDNNNVSGISTSNSIVLVNGIFQTPSRPGAVSITGGYDLLESAGISTVSFVGTSATVASDINVTSIPRGGIIISVGSTNGFGYQPLVAAGGTAVVSIAGTIGSISIGNSGSGYRNGYQVVNVGVGTSSVYGSNIEFIGTATISGGHVVSVAITNPGTGYTSTNPPYVFFDSPLSYSNIPLVYSSSSTLGLGTGAIVDIVVGQGSSVVNFEIKNFGYGYGQKEILTIPTSGSIGIPTNPNLPFSEFSIIIDRTYNDSFSGWTIGDLQILDPLDSLFDGERTNFPISINGNQTTIRTRVGSNIDIESTLLIFVNDVLQVPGEGYKFEGGSTITFTEAPGQGDTSTLIFYRGTGEVDTALVDILETVKPGDTLQINSDIEAYKQSERMVTEIISSDVARTNVYARDGLSDDVNLLRPVTWCKQEFDMVINGQQVTKDRVQYEPYIYPISNIIENVGTSSTTIYVESVKTFFDSVDEYVQDGTNEKPQKSIKIVENDTLVAASATAVVSSGGTIQSIVITNSGIGYTITDVPNIVIGNPIGVALTERATATAVVSPLGTITSISVDYPGVGYTFTNPPQVLIEPPSPKVEVLSDVTYSGDFGIIVGYGISTISLSDNAIFDFYIPQNSYLRDVDVVGSAITMSQIEVGDFFVVNSSNIGVANTSFFTFRTDTSVIGLSTHYSDGIYQVNAVEDVYRDVTGVGNTYVRRVFALVEPTTGISTIGYGSSTIFFDSTYYTYDYLGITTYSGGTISTSNYFGDYSWGKISNFVRSNPQSFNSYGFDNINSSPSVVRVNPLKYENYTN